MFGLVGAFPYIDLQKLSGLLPSCLGLFKVSWVNLKPHILIEASADHARSRWSVFF